MVKKPKINDGDGWSVWFSENWRSIALIVYCVICMFDFVIMPGIFEYTNKSIDPANAIALAKNFDDSSVQLEIVKQLTSKRAWEPLTMGGAAAFHFAFGALLTGVAMSVGREKVEQIKTTRSRYQKSTSYKPDNPDEEEEY